MDLFYDPDSYEFDQKKYENDYPGLKKFFESFSEFKEKINIKEMTFSEFERDISYLEVIVKIQCLIVIVIAINYNLKSYNLIIRL